jgi:tetratricopeptide (TPR) repeat protein
MGALHLVDHLIRVHPETQSPASQPLEIALRTQISPVSVYLRIIAVDSRVAAAQAVDRLRNGQSFYQVARDISVDKSAAIGGYLGRRVVAELDSALSSEAAHLSYGGRSGVLESGDKWVILQRLPRDFRWQAEQLERQAETLAASNEPIAAIGKAQEALAMYSEFLRALHLIGSVFASNGNPKKAAEVLTTATHLYPADAGAQFALASTLEILHDDTAAANGYRRATTLEEDYTAAYIKLAELLCKGGDWRGAIVTLRHGLQVDPLSAELNYDLGLALARSGDPVGSKQAFTLASRLDPNLREPGSGPVKVSQPGAVSHLANQ